MPLAAASTKITAKGQVTLRRGLLDHIGARPGDRLEIVPAAGGRLEIRCEKKTGSLDAFYGSIKSGGMPPLTIDEMNEAIAQAVVDEFNGCD